MKGLLEFIRNKDEENGLNDTFADIINPRVHVGLEFIRTPIEFTRMNRCKISMSAR
ncbi:hypothetical protein QJS04_geneDACA004705 [Acorus gramineus]|uniref:Uncharacterized protein n=1 Tax=Acorus gramineus TaxID=55184 RepID=A0AAV9BX16_ACOGR|nr:hypothetical protein QJS04_geneDACA004705 [Acorus gramineus]